MYIIKRLAIVGFYGLRNLFKSGANAYELFLATWDVTKN